MEANTWVETQDWSNSYADDWYDYPESNTSMTDHHIESAPMIDETHEEAPMPTDAPDGNIA